MSDKLDAVRDAAEKLRDVESRIERLTEELETLNNQLNEMRRETLPNLFMETGIDRVTLADGTDFVLKPYYHASIAASWPPEKREAAFAHLEEQGFGDVIKRQFNVMLPRGDAEAAKKLEAELNELGFSYSQKLDVPWATLTALVKEQFESGNKTLDLGIIGATAGMVVTDASKRKRKP